MIVQTGVKFNSEYGLELPPDIRLYDVPDTYTAEKLVNEVEREHIRQIIQQVTGSKFSNEHLDAMQQIAVRLVATFKEQKKRKFVSSENEMPEPNRHVIIKTKPQYEGDTDIYSINRLVPCYCKRYFRGECHEIKWEHDFYNIDPFEWCYLDLETE